jgi:diguanylate cyclase (GGDEF)-like protein
MAPSAGVGDAFQLHIAQRLGTAHRNPAPFTVMLLAPERWHSLAEQYGRDVALEVVAMIEQRARGAVRRGDLVLRFREDVVAMLLEASRTAAHLIGQRVVQACTRDACKLGSGLVLRAATVAGAAAYPEDGDRAGELRAKAEAALQHARVEGRSPQWPPDTVAPQLPQRPAHTGVVDEQKPLLDELTGVLQDSHLGTALQKYVARYWREDRPVSLLCLDVDYLRRYNDQYGRKTGDQLLRSVADFLQRSTREDDLIARWAGDQFVIAMPCTAAEAVGAGQRLWAAIRKTAFVGIGPGLRLTVTIGVSNVPDHGSNARQLFEAAQIALRVAKSKGRNQVLAYQHDLRQSKAGQQAVEAF